MTLALAQTHTHTQTHVCDTRHMSVQYQSRPELNYKRYNYIVTRTYCLFLLRSHIDTLIADSLRHRTFRSQRGLFNHRVHKYKRQRTLVKKIKQARDNRED